MSAGIIPGVDAGCIGYKEHFGGTWHGFPEYEVIDGPVSMEQTRKILEHEVVMNPVTLTGDFEGEETEMFALVRKDTGRVLYKESVSDEYYITQNKAFLDQLQLRILTPNPQVSIESTGTLFAFRVGFVNLLLNRFRVNGDDSETIARLMYYNAFGGRSITAGAHTTRIECANTMNMAEAQAYANATIKKFKHTKNAEKRLADHLVDLGEMYSLMETHKDALNWLSSQTINSTEVQRFVGNLFALPAKASKTMISRRTRERGELLQHFEDCDNLQGAIARTRFSMLQAVIWYANNNNIRGDSDMAYSYFNTVSGGTRDALNQQAFRLLTCQDIPLPVVDITEPETAGETELAPAE